MDVGLTTGGIMVWFFAGVVVGAVAMWIYCTKGGDAKPKGGGGPGADDGP